MLRHGSIFVLDPPEDKTVFFFFSSTAMHFNSKRYEKL